MSKMRVECHVCGSIYELTSQNVHQINKDTVTCQVCNNVVFEYNDFKIWYPFLSHRKEHHNPADPEMNAPSDGQVTEPEF